MYALNYGGKDVQLTSEQITASLFTKLKEIGENALGTKVSFHHMAIMTLATAITTLAMIR